MEEIVFVTHNRGKIESAKQQLKEVCGHEGTVSEEILGNDADNKWSDLWYIFKPYGYDKTLAQMTEEERNTRVRYESIDSFQEFAKWYKENRKEGDKANE